MHLRAFILSTEDFMAIADWEKIKIDTDDSQEVQASSPVIISASRSTDIPAWYSEWFINRLKKGYVVWTNPFNQSPQYISFSNTRVIVFWTKNPLPLIPYLNEIDDREINYYFQYTINDYVDEKFEPNVPGLAERIETFKKLSDLLGPDRVVWRFDPLILTNTVDVDRLLDKIHGVGEKLHTFTKKLVFSFCDISQYKKVQDNLKRENINYKDFTLETMGFLARGLQALNKDWGLELGTCGEAIDFAKYGIIHNKCIDDTLMIELFKSDSILMKFLGHQTSCQTSFLQENNINNRPNLKDQGQRKACGCIISKDIGMYNTCNHLCVYCYANTSKKVVHSNLKKHNAEKESII